MRDSQIRRYLSSSNIRYRAPSTHYINLEHIRIPIAQIHAFHLQKHVQSLLARLSLSPGCPSRQPEIISSSIRSQKHAESRSLLDHISTHLAFCKYIRRLDGRFECLSQSYLLRLVQEGFTILSLELLTVGNRPSLLVTSLFECDLYVPRTYTDQPIYHNLSASLVVLTKQFKDMQTFAAKNLKPQRLKLNEE